MRISEHWLGEFVELPTFSALADALIVAGVEIEQVIQSPASGRSLDLSITPNRADLLSHLGLAREVAANSGKRLLAPKWRLHEAGPRVETLARLELESPDCVRRYVGRVVRGVEVQESPEWLKERLAALDMRSVNNVVDVTNYVMLELGIPLHAFDLAHIASTAGLPTLQVRRAAAGEQLRTLDGQARKLGDEDLVIADANGPLALAGVLGGRDSEITTNTRDVFLEAAAFAAPGINHAARRHGLRTEASLRFGRGVDVAMVARAAERAAALLAEITGGEVATGALDWRDKQDATVEILLPLKKVASLLGLQLEPKAVVDLLEPLQIRCLRRIEGALVFEVPSFRVDLSRDVDLLEEVARRFGLDHIPSQLPHLSQIMPAAKAAATRRRAPAPERGSKSTARPAGWPSRPTGRLGSRVRDSLLAAGLSECVHFAFAPASKQAPFARPDRVPVSLQNPLGEEQRMLRTSLLPGLLTTLQYNARRGQSGLIAFEIGTVFWRRTQQDEKKQAALATRELPSELSSHVQAAHATLPHEQVHLACLLTGPRPMRTSWQRTSDEGCDGHDLMGIWQAICAAYALAVPSGLSPDAAVDGPLLGGGSAGLYLCPADAPPQRLGQLGQLDPAYVRQYDWHKPVFVLEVALAELERAPERQWRGVMPPKFPPTRRDLAVVAPRTLPAETVRAYLADQASAGLNNVTIEVRLFDVYAGKHVPSGHVSLAFAIVYQSSHETLTDEQISPAFQALMQRVQQRFGIAVRDGSSQAAP